ncbi:MAG: VWA domain-containing protein, partial [bacterium]|nr:VWA domain-containing protein [bacterium]
MNAKNMMYSLLAMVVAPAIAFAQPAPTAASKSAHDCVVVVFDDSGSMNEPFSGGSRLHAAKRGLKVVLRSVPSTTWVGLLAINAGWLYPINPLDLARINGIIDEMDTPGGTPLARNIKAGADALMAERAKQFGYGSYRLLVVTDGEETEDQGAIERFPPEVRARGLTLDVIGIGIGQEHALRKHAHTYRGADNPAALETAMREVLAERVDTGDQTGGDAFELVAGLDPGVAAQAIVALGNMPNYPIGEQPPVASTGSGGGSSPGAGGGGPTSVGPPNGCGCSEGANG